MRTIHVPLTSMSIEQIVHGNRLVDVAPLGGVNATPDQRRLAELAFEETRTGMPPHYESAARVECNELHILAEEACTSHRAGILMGHRPEKK